MAALCSHITDQGEQMLRYYGLYSNVTRSRLKKEVESGLDCYIILEDEYPKKSNRSWARLIMKIYEVNPLICPRCGGVFYPELRKNFGEVKFKSYYIAHIIIQTLASLDDK